MSKPTPNTETTEMVAGLRAAVEAIDHHNTEWRYEHRCGSVFGKSFDGGEMRVCDIRSWGYLTGNGHGGLALDKEAAGKAADALGAFIAACNPIAIAALLATLDAAEQRASSERNKALEEAAAIAAEQEEDGSYVWADGFEIADAIRALQNGGGDA